MVLGVGYWRGESVGCWVCARQGILVGVWCGWMDLHWLPVRLYQIYNWGGNLRDYENVAIYYFHEVNK